MRISHSYRYRLVDVFTQQALEGNALAVFTDATGMDTETMQRVAREMNLSETTFILPPTRNDCAANVRIFTPNREMPFAGHPTIGTSFVMLDEGIVPKRCRAFVIEKKFGQIPIRIEKGDRPMIWLSTPTITWRRQYDRAICASALGLQTNDLLDATPQLVTAGNDTICRG